jgi:two-component system phosphate regulon sensor histidine kinase PhoR
MSKRLHKDPFRIFYIVFAYILIFALWWAYLLFSKNETAYRELITINTIRHEISGEDGVQYKDTAEYLDIIAKHNRQRLMILGEGMVFVLLLFIGLLLVRRAFKKEIELAQQQRNFLLSVTHELKSPLSSVKLSLQTIQLRNPDAEKKAKLTNNALADIDRLENLVDNILFAAKIERESHGFSDEEVNVSRELNNLCERLSVNKKGIYINKKIDDDLIVKADKLGLTSIITNLIDNALKYSENNSEVFVQLSVEGENMRLCVSDHGIGIDDVEKEKIFDKFYRVGSEETRRTKGTGLGLYIVKRFVEIYNGKIQVEDNKPKGVKFIITLPLAAMPMHEIA